MTHIEDAALATCTLTLNLIEQLRLAGILADQQVASIFEDSIRQHRSVNTDANEAAALFLESARVAVENE